VAEVPYFLMGAIEAGWYDLVVTHPTATQCELLDARFEPVPGTPHVPVVDGFETYLYLRCTP
jgi:hypothetical protein